MAALEVLPGAPVIRETGAIYLSDFMTDTIRLEVVEAAPIYFDIQESRYLGTLRLGQEVELQAISDHAYRVRGRAQQGQVVGWVSPDALAGLAEETVEALKASAERKAMVDELIARNEVAIGMTETEVEASLGRPQKKTSRLDASGRFDVWEYIRYDRVPQQVTSYDAYGRPFLTTIYVRVPVGELSVLFEQGVVNALEQSEGTLLRDDRVRVVVPPILY